MSEEKRQWFKPKKQGCRNKVEKKIQDNGIDKDQFSEILQHDNGVVAGSFIVSSLLDDCKWSPGDIDIWFPYISVWTNTTMHQYLTTLGYTISNASWVGDSEYARFQREVSGYYIYDKPDSIQIQIIIMKQSNVLQQCIIGFDIDICRMYYDGDNVYGYGIVPSNIPPTVAITMECQQTSFEYMRSINRLIKYYYRGFKVIFPNVVCMKIAQEFNRSNYTIRLWNNVASTNTFIPYIVCIGNRVCLIKQV